MWLVMGFTLFTRIIRAPLIYCPVLYIKKKTFYSHILRSLLRQITRMHAGACKAGLGILAWPRRRVVAVTSGAGIQNCRIVGCSVCRSARTQQCCFITCYLYCFRLLALHVYCFQLCILQIWYLLFKQICFHTVSDNCYVIMHAWGMLLSAARSNVLLTLHIGQLYESAYRLTPIIFYLLFVWKLQILLAVGPLQWWGVTGFLFIIQKYKNTKSSPSTQSYFLQRNVFLFFFFFYRSSVNKHSL